MKISEVAFDIDGIALDTPTLIWQSVMDHLGLDWDMNLNTEYDIGLTTGIPMKGLRSVYEHVLSRPDIPGIPGAFEALTEIARSNEMELLFVTARRAKFKKAAIECLHNGLPDDVKFKVLCTGDKAEDEFRSDKSKFLLARGVRLFIEDNPLHWEDYMDVGISIGTLAWPYTIEPAQTLYDNGRWVFVCPNWRLLKYFIQGFVDGRKANS